jgi:hypothetical protein
MLKNHDNLSETASNFISFEAWAGSVESLIGPGWGQKAGSRPPE